MIRILLVLVFSICQLQSEKRFFTPTSVLVHVAEMAARDEGFPIEKEDLFFFDLPTKNTRSGYATIGFFGNGHPIHWYSINELTGQVVDDVHCEVFRFRDLEVFARSVQKETGEKPMTDSELAADLGCDKLKVIDKRFKTKK